MALSPEESFVPGGAGFGAPQPGPGLLEQVDLTDLLSAQATGGPTRLPYNPLTEEEALLYPSTFSADTPLVKQVTDRLFAPVFGTPIPQVGVSAAFGAAVGAGLGGGVGALPGAAIGAAIGILADALGTTADIKVQQALEGGGGLETPLGNISPELAGFITNMAIQIPATGGLAKAAFRGARGLGWIQAAKDVEAQLGLPVKDLLPQGMKMRDALASIPGGKAFYEVDDRYRILARAHGRYGQPPDWDAFFMNRAKMSKEAREWVDSNMLAPTEELFQAPEFEGVLKTLFPATAAARGAGAFSDFIWNRMFAWAVRPGRVVYGDPAAMRALDTMRSAEMSNKGFAEGLGKIYDDLFAGVSEADQTFLRQVWHHAQGLSPAQMRKAARQPTNLPVEDVFPGAAGAEKELLEKLQAGRVRPRKKQTAIFDDAPMTTPAVSFAQERERVVSLLTRTHKTHLIPKYDAMSKEFQAMGRDLVDLGVLDEKHLIPNYLSFVRQKFEAQGVTLVELEQGYFPATVANIIPHRVREYFLRERRRTVPPEEVSLRDTWGVYTRAYSNLLHNQQMYPYLKELMPQIADPRKATYIGNMFNYFAGARGGAGAAEEVSRSATNVVKTLQFWRIIGGSVLSPLVNSMQRVNFLGFSSWKNWLRGMVPNKHLNQIAREEGVVQQQVPLASQYADIDPETGSGMLYDAIMRGPLRSIGDVLTKPFMWTENANRFHAFRSAFYQAMEQPGMTTGQAVQAAKLLSDDSNFITRIGRTPAIMRGELGSVFGQFKLYTINQLGYMEILSRRNPRGAARVLSAALLLMGPDAILPGFDLTMSRHLLGEVNKSPFKGALGHLGVSMADMSSIFGVGRDDFARLNQYIAPPVVENVQSLLGATLGVSFGKGFDMERFGMPMSPDERASAIARSIPFGGSQANRARVAAKLMQSGNEDRGAQTLLEAFGAEASQGPLRQRLDRREAQAKFAGLESPRMKEKEEISTLVREMQEEYNQTMGRISELLARGRVIEADELTQRFRRRYPELSFLFPTVAGVRRGAERLIMPQAMRAVRGLPLHLQLPYMQQIMAREL